MNADLAVIDVEISAPQMHLRVDPDALAGLVRRVLRAEGVARGSISLSLVDNAAIHTINRRHLGHDWPTDVITFRLSEPDDEFLSGELVISAEMAADTAREARVDAWNELALYVVHGLLHLCGYNDETADERTTMRQREDEVLTREGLANTFPKVGMNTSDCEEPEETPWTA
jgi:probable rRNA maturation factor